ncbi:MAG: entericidin A/B family lipoprotein [Gammaproteobacteria bacterium]|nr:entericidin A/B family lipoprotein [Gammaproteobacteria bacterium]NND61546.1 entericidin A/B family lipoprotein [Gammaproteobacteria bacterium]
MTGCETIEGAGQDIQNAGEVVEDAADEDGRY